MGLARQMIDENREDEAAVSYQAAIKAREAFRDLLYSNGQPGTQVTKAGDYKITVTVERYVVPK